MKRWALVRNKIVLSVFAGSDNASDYPSIAAFLVEVGANVRDNMVDQGGGVFAYPVSERAIETEDFLNRFTAGEYNAIMANNTARNFIMRKVQTRPTINPDGAATIAYMDTLVTAGFITSQRKTEILS